MKKIPFLALALFVILSLLPTAAFAAELEIIWLPELSEEYTFYKSFVGGVAIVERTKPEEMVGLIDKTGKMVAPLGKYDEIQEIGKTGFIKVVKGKVPTDENGHFDWYNDERKYGYIDRTGREVVPVGEYDFFDDSFCDGLLKVGKNGKWGLINETGEVVLPVEYVMIGDFRDGLAEVKRESDDVNDGKYGLIDKTGRLVLPAEYDAVDIRPGGYAEVWRNGESSTVDRTGKEPPKGDGIEFYNGVAVVAKWEPGHVTYNLIDKSGNIVAPLDFLEDAFGCQIEPFSEGLAAICTGLSSGSGKWGYIDTTGKLVVPFEYTDARPFSNGVAIVARDSYQWGVIDKTGREVVPCGKYTGIQPFSDGFALARQPITEGLYGDCIIDTTGREITSVGQYDDVGLYRGDGLAPVRIGKEVGYIDTTGQVVLPLKYYGGVSLPYFAEGLLPWSKDGKVGYIDKTGQMVIPFEFNGASNFSEGVAWVHKDGKRGILKNPLHIAYPSTQSIEVDGKDIEFQCYVLRDENGNDINYIKLRDIASVFIGTSVEFEVGWNGAVNIETKKSYTPNGSEMSTPFSDSRIYESAAPTNINGVQADLEAIILRDYKGGSYTYYKLRDLGQALGFNVGWSASKGVFIETDKPYNPKG